MPLRWNASFCAASRRRPRRARFTKRRWERSWPCRGAIMPLRRSVWSSCGLRDMKSLRWSRSRARRCSERSGRSRANAMRWSSATRWPAWSRRSWTAATAPSRFRRRGSSTRSTCRSRAAWCCGTSFRGCSLDELALVRRGRRIWCVSQVAGRAGTCCRPELPGCTEAGKGLCRPSACNAASAGIPAARQGGYAANA